MSTPTNTTPVSTNISPGIETNATPNNTENVEVSQETSEENQASPVETKAAETKAVAKAIKELKLKIDGKEVIEKLPFSIDENPETIEYLTRQLQMARMGQKRAQDFSSLEKEVTKFFTDLKSNPRKVLSDKNIGVDIKKLVTEYLEEEVANSAKSPEQIEKEKLEAKLKDLEDERKKEKEEYSQKEFQRLQEKAYMDYDAQMSKAIESSDLPKTGYVLKKMADYMLMGLNAGLDVSPQDVLPLVQEEIFSDLKDLIGALGEDKVEKLIGKDILKKVRQKNIAKAKTPPTPVNAIKDTGTSKVEEKQVLKKKTIKEMWGI